MIIIDAQLSPHLAPWVADNFGVECFSAKYLDLLCAEDKQIFEFAKKSNAIVMTKDEDFVQLLHRFGSPPKIIWITCGNTSNEQMKQLLNAKLTQALLLLQEHDLVELTD